MNKEISIACATMFSVVALGMYLLWPETNFMQKCAFIVALIIPLIYAFILYDRKEK